MRMNMFAVCHKVKPDIEYVKSLILGGGQVYDRSSDQTAVIAGAAENTIWTDRGRLNVVYAYIITVHV
jgi:hypothetical protein